MELQLISKEYSLREAFGPPYPDDQTVVGYAPSDCEFVPQKDPWWRWDRNLLRDLIIWWKDAGSDPAYLFGPTGCGKSSAIVNFCASLGIPLYERTMYAGLEFPEVVAKPELIDGSTYTNYGLLPMAMGALGYPGIFCANEVDRADDAVITGFYEVLEGRPLITDIGGADIVSSKEGFRFVGTGNTALAGDTTGLYVGAKQQDLAFQDRVYKFRVNYPPPDLEEALLRDLVPNLPEQLVKLMVAVAGEIRAAFMGESDSARALPLTMSTRALCRWAQATWLYRGAQTENVSPVYYALDRAFLNAADGDPEVRKAIEVIVHGKLGNEQGIPV